MKGLAVGLLVGLVNSAPLAAQEGDRSLQRISLALQQPIPIVPGGVPFQADFPKRLGIFTLVQPTMPGEMVRVSIPIGELISRAFKTVAAANQRRREVAARHRVEAALARFANEQARPKP